MFPQFIDGTTMTEPEPSPEDSGECDPPMGPDEAELPDEIPDPDELDPFEVEVDAYEDINDFVDAEWAESTTARHRVRKVILRIREPVTVTAVAEFANVSEPTARQELNQLVEAGEVRVENGQNGKVYQRDPARRRLRRLQQYSQQPKATLESALRQLRREIEEYKQAYEVDTPEDLILSRGSLDDETWADISHWRTAAVDLEYVRTALQLRRLRSAENDAPSLDDEGDEETEQLSI